MSSGWKTFMDELAAMEGQPLKKPAKGKLPPEVLEAYNAVLSMSCCFCELSLTYTYMNLCVATGQAVEGKEPPNGYSEGGECIVHKKGDAINEGDCRKIIDGKGRKRYYFDTEE
eukprot:4034333-Amphidinium_carterae.3